MRQSKALQPYLLYIVLAAVTLGMFQVLYLRAVERATMRDLRARHAPLDNPSAGDLVILVADDPAGVPAEAVEGPVTLPNGTLATIRSMAGGAIVVELLENGRSAAVFRSDVRVSGGPPQHTPATADRTR